MGAVWSVADPPIFAASERIILSIRVKAGSMMPRTASFSVVVVMQPSMGLGK